MIDLEKVFEIHENEYLKFDRVENPPNPRPDISAFILLDWLMPKPGRCILSAAEHDEIFLDIDIDKLASIATSEDILMLIRCGVRLDSATDSLAMFV